jgi:hypothetical protein
MVVMNSRKPDLFRGIAAAMGRRRLWSCSWSIGHVDVDICWNAGAKPEATPVENPHRRC